MTPGEIRSVVLMGASDLAWAQGWIKAACESHGVSPGKAEHFEQSIERLHAVYSTLGELAGGE